jgi:hypothetical protein
VSFSNPTRQCLFEFEDAEQKKFKSHAAAERLKKIFPSINSDGVVLTVWLIKIDKYERITIIKLKIIYDYYYI